MPCGNDSGAVTVSTVPVAPNALCTTAALDLFSMMPFSSPEITPLGTGRPEMNAPPCTHFTFSAMNAVVSIGTVKVTPSPRPR